MLTHARCAIKSAGPTVLLILALGVLASAQNKTATVPRLITFGATLKDAAGKPQTGPVALTFSLYTEPDSRTPVWQETQNVDADVLGSYTVLLGAASPNGMPLDLFSSRNALWLGVQPWIAGAPEQPRTLLVSVAYALNVADADTLGGKPASAYVTRESLSTGAAISPSGESVGGNVEQSALMAHVSPGSSVPNPLVIGTTGGTLIGGVTTTAVLNLQSTSGSGTSASAINFLLGNNGGTLAGSFLNNGNFSLSTGTILTNNSQSNVLIGGGGLNITTGFGNSSAAPNALRANTSGNWGVAIGFAALQNNTTGIENMATGVDAMVANSTGRDCTAFGTQALEGNYSGGYNTAVGAQTMELITSAISNTAIGAQALKSTLAGFNTAAGISALYDDTTGYNNSALGNLAGNGPSRANANLTGYHNTYLGDEAGPSSNTQYVFQTDIGSLSAGSCNNCIVIGRPADTTKPAGPLQYGSYTFSTLPVASNGTVVYCSDCMNVRDDRALYDAAAAGGGHGTLVGLENGQWRNH